MLADLVKATGKSRRELTYRMQFADKFPSEDEVCNALHTLKSWAEVIRSMATPRPKRVNHRGTGATESVHGHAQPTAGLEACLECPT